MYMMTTPDAFYVRNLLELEANIFQGVGKGKTKIHYRTIFRDHLPGTDGLGKDLDNELFIRLLVGPTIPLSQKTELVLEGEVFLKPTADTGDSDGEELFNLGVLWAGANVKVGKHAKLLLRYVGQYNNLINNDDIKKVVWDHNAHLNVQFELPPKKK
jgi:hypothetical protein